MTQSQRSGFMFENIIRTMVFNLREEINNTDKFDICKKNNKFNFNENISIKSTCSNNIDCADILRIYDYDMQEQNTIIVVKYKQISTNKVIQNIFEIDFNREMYNLLFGKVTKEILIDYINIIKTLPNGKVSRENRNKYIQLKKNIEIDNLMKIGIRPKVDSKNQRRVQCSIPNFEVLLDKFIISKSVNTIRGIEIPLEYESNRRIRI